MCSKSVVAALTLLCLWSGAVSAQTAGRATLGVAVAQMDAVVAGWSAKKTLLGKPIVNDQKQRVGKVEDIIITPDNAVSFAIVSTGGFVGVGKHDVAIPIDQIKFADGNFVLPGATKDALKALPKFEYTKQ